MTKQNQIFSCSLQSLGEIREFVADYSSKNDISNIICGEIELAVNEVCTNIIVNGGFQENSDKFEITLEVRDEMFAATVSYSGKKYNLAQMSKNLPVKDSKDSSSNISLFAAYVLKQMVDVVMYNYSKDKVNELCLIKDIPRLT